MFRNLDKSRTPYKNKVSINKLVIFLQGSALYKYKGSIHGDLIFVGGSAFVQVPAQNGPDFFETVMYVLTVVR